MFNLNPFFYSSLILFFYPSLQSAISPELRECWVQSWTSSWPFFARCRAGYCPFVSSSPLFPLFFVFYVSSFLFLLLCWIYWYYFPPYYLFFSVLLFVFPFATIVLIFFFYFHIFKCWRLPYSLFRWLLLVFKCMFWLRLVEFYCNLWIFREFWVICLILH